MACREELKIVLVGGSRSGKTSAVLSHLENRFLSDYVPTVFDNFSTIIQLGEDTQRATLWDTAGQRAYSRLRLLVFPQTDVFLLCFAVTSRASLHDARDVFYPEIAAELHCDKACVVLVGTHADARGDKPDEEVSTEEALEFALEIGAPYIEVSALTKHNLRKLYMLAVHQGVGPHSACSAVLFCPIPRREQLRASALAFLTVHKYGDGPVCSLPGELLQIILEMTGILEWKSDKYREVSDGLWMPADAAYPVGNSTSLVATTQRSRRRCMRVDFPDILKMGRPQFSKLL